MGKYGEFLEYLSRRHGVPVELLEQRVQSRRAKMRGLSSRHFAARTIGWTMGVDRFLASSTRHISGLQLQDAVAAAQLEGASGNCATLAYWPQTEDGPEQIVAQYISAVEAIADLRLDASISVKVDLVQYERAKLRPLFDLAERNQVRVHFDAQDYATAEPTRILVEEAKARGVDVSATLPSRWRRSLDDAECLVALKIPMRIVKGQAGDPGDPGVDPRKAYLDLVRRVRGRGVHVGVATHDRRTAEPALQLLQAAGTPCSLEQLRSLPRLDSVARQLGIPVRAYIAYGRFGLPYAIAELWRRPAIIGWIVRDLVVRGRSPAGCSPPE